MKSYILTAMLIGGCLAIISSIKSSQRQFVRDFKEKNKGKGTKLDFDFAKTQAISLGATGFVVVVNFLLQFIIRRFSLGERHETSTKMNVSVAFKLTVARFLNSSFILVLVNNDPLHWFEGANLAYDALLLVVIMAFSAPLTAIVDPKTQIKKLKRCWEKSKGEDC